jgi:hypothetical protein
MLQTYFEINNMYNLRLTYPYISIEIWTAYMDQSTKSIIKSNNYYEKK